MPYYIDELKPGMSERYEKTVTERDIELFGEVSGDMNPVHFDEAFARGTIFRGRIAHGVLSISFISTVLGTKLPCPGCTHLLDGLDGAARHIGRRASFHIVAKSPVARLAAWASSIVRASF